MLELLLWGYWVTSSMIAFVILKDYYREDGKPRPLLLAIVVSVLAGWFIVFIAGLRAVGDKVWDWKHRE